MKRILLTLFCVVLIMGSAAYAHELTGQEILDDLTFSAVFSGSGTAELTMVTENARGAQRKFSLEVFLKSDDDGDKQFLEYLNPADVRGTKFLSINEKDKESQMWLYMPALGRERRVASHMTGDSFMGTDFTFDEIGGNFATDNDYSAKRLGDEEEMGVTCYVLDLTAKTSSALYERVKMWVWKEEMVPVKVEFYDQGTEPLKTLTLSDFHIVSDELIPHNIIMADNSKGTKTYLQIDSVSQDDVSDDVFTVRYLRR